MLTFSSISIAFIFLALPVLLNGTLWDTSNWLENISFRVLPSSFTRLGPLAQIILVTLEMILQDQSKPTHYVNPT